jgi:hypothetical protein
MQFWKIKTKVFGILNFNVFILFKNHKLDAKKNCFQFESLFVI